MNHWISPHRSPYHEPPFGFPAVNPLAVPVPEQGQFGYSDPRRHRSETVNSVQDFNPYCPSPLAISPNGHLLAQSPSLAISASSHLLGQPAPFGTPTGRHLPAFSPTVPEHTPNYTRKDTYWTNNPPTTIRGVQQKVARAFVDYRTEYKRRKRLAFLERLPFNMSSSTALLPKDQQKKMKRDEHPIFLRVCHSPWIAIGQKALVTLRGITATYLLASFIMIIQYDLQFNKLGWLTAFDLANIAYFLQVLYAWIAFTWTYMHLFYPHHGSQIETTSTRIQMVFSPPRQNPTTKNRTFFSIFFTAAVTYPHIVNFIFWAILTPKKQTTIPVDEIFSHGWYYDFYLFNKFGVNSVIALMEVFIYCSIRRQDALPGHIFGLAVLTLLYAGWAFVGYVVTDKFVYFFLNHKTVGWPYVGGSVGCLVVLTWIWFAFVYGVIGIREKLTKRGEDKKVGYTRLPQ